MAKGVCLIARTANSIDSIAHHPQDISVYLYILIDVFCIAVAWRIEAMPAVSRSQTMSEAVKVYSVLYTKVINHATGDVTIGV